MLTEVMEENTESRLGIGLVLETLPLTWSLFVSYRGCLCTVVDKGSANADLSLNLVRRMA